MKSFVSKRISQLVQSDIRAMTKECVRLKGINLGQGLCELPTPPEAVDAAISALRNDAKNTYSPAEGTKELRTAISKKLAYQNGIESHPDKNIVVTVGAAGGFASTLMALLDPGDGILLFEPYYGYHVNAAILAELEPQYIPMLDEQLSVDRESILAAIQPNTKAIMICTPSNPSGKMFSESELQVIGEIANEKDLLVITDEMYEYFRYENRKHISPASLKILKDRTVSLMGLSKTFSITGWRLGYVAAPEPLAEKIKLANDLFYVCAPTPLQHGVARGFSIDKSYFKNLQDEFEKRRDRFCETLLRVGMKPIVPQGAYYALADISSFGFDSSKAAAMAILEQVGVAAVPGKAFFSGTTGEKYLRFCFAVKEEKLEEAMKRLSDFKV